MTTTHELAHTTPNPDHGHRVVIFIDGTRYELRSPIQTGSSLKQLAEIALDFTLFLAQPGEDLVIGNDTKVTLKNGAKLHSQPPANYGSLTNHGNDPHPPHRRVGIIIDNTPYSVEPKQTGRALKTLANLPPEAELFLKRHGEDLVVANDTTIHLKDGDRLYSQIPAIYGLGSIPDGHKPSVKYSEFPQPDGWLFVVLHDLEVPPEYQPTRVDVLVKLPPTFPAGSPDMFWVSPELKLANGGSPRSTSHETALGKNWQRFSWHLVPGAWRIGVSTFHDYLRCIRGRFEKKD